ncbi:MAG TPA: transposase [Mycobacterium sp.]|nr:transposase [Mycobacterium sp.]HUH70518.1 transposase [Mycobacterium sp.]
MKVSADGYGVVSHAGVGMVREVADLTGLSTEVTAALADTYQGPWIHAPGDVFADLAAAVADGADCVDGVGQLWADRSHVRVSRLDDHAVAVCRGAHRRRSPFANPGGASTCPRAGVGRRGGPDHDGWLHLDVDAIITIDHSTRRNAAATWKHTFGCHPLLVFLDRPDIAAGEALAELLRPGNAGSKYHRRSHRRAGSGAELVAAAISSWR